MTVPGVIIERGERGPAALASDDVGTFFDAVMSERGPVGEAVVCRSWAQVRSIFGDHTAYSTLRAVEAHFRDGGTRAYLSRIVGDDAAEASIDLDDSGGDPVLTITVPGPGEWANEFTAEVLTGSGSTRTIVIVNEAGDEILRWTGTTAAAAQDAINAVGLVAELGAGDWPPVAAAEDNFAGGTDDRGAIDDDDVTDALDVFDCDLGPGTIAASGRTTTLIHKALFARARANNRFALADAPDTANISTLTAAAAALRAEVDAGYGQLLWPWETVVIAGLTVAIPPSGGQAGRMARADREHAPGPAQAAAGRFGPSRYATGVTQVASKADRETLHEAGVTVIALEDGFVAARGTRTLVDVDLWPQYAEVGGMRVAMAIESQARAALKQRGHQNLDGKGHVAAHTRSDLLAICKAWFDRDALGGATPDEAYQVEVSSALAPQRRLEATLLIRPTTSAEVIRLVITQVAPGDAI